MGPAKRRHGLRLCDPGPASARKRSATSAMRCSVDERSALLAITSWSIPVATTDADDSLEALVERRAKDDVRVLVDLFANACRRLVELIERKVVAPVIEMSRPRTFMDTSSRSGLAIAASAARCAFSPEASPVPIMALPMPRMTDRTSAKSRLMRPSLTIRSVMRDAGVRTWSAIAKASAKVVFGRDAEQVLIRDDDERVDGLLQFADARLGEAHAAGALELERLGDDADRQDPELSRRASRRARRPCRCRRPFPR